MFIFVPHKGCLREQEFVILEPITNVLHEVVDVTEDLDLMVIHSEGIHYFTTTR